jgi:hypothetical protein
VRFVADPNYVDGGHDYVVRSRSGAPGWEELGTAPSAALTDEAFEFDPEPERAAAGPR